MKNVSLFVLLMQFLCFAGNSQTVNTDATVILKNNTVKNGTLKYKDWESSPESIQFKETGENDFVTYSPDDIRSFTVNNIRYNSATLLTDNTPIASNELSYEAKYDTVTKCIFIKRLVSGKKSLYEYVSRRGVSNFYIQYHQDSIALLEFKRFIVDAQHIENVDKYKIQLAFQFGDCENVLIEIGKLSYDERSLSDIFRKYSECHGEKPVLIRKEKLKYTLDVFAGLTLNSIRFPGPADQLFAGSDYKSYVAANLLISGGLPVSKKFQRRHFMGEIGIKLLKVKGTDSIKGGFGAYYLTSFDLKYLYIKGNLLFRQYIGNQKRPLLFCDIGLSMGQAIQSSGDVKNVTKNFTYKTYTGISKSDAAAIIGLGTCYNRISAAMRYEQGNLLTLNNNVSTNMKTFGLFFGYRIF